MFYSHSMSAIPDNEHPYGTDLGGWLSQFDPIHLDSMADAALLDRVDTKYIFGLDQLITVLPALLPHYRALSIDHIRLHAYRTLYFDTDDFALYTQHHNGIASRFKVRARKYVDTDLAFFEIKHRTNQRRTVKSRLPIADVVTQLDGQLLAFSQAQAFDHADVLEPKLWNEYQRMTLVSNYRPERVTLDVNLQYIWGRAYVALPSIVIAEVKQAHRSQDAEFIHQMRRLGIRPMAYSKYTAGVYSLYSGVKTNNFKAQMRQVHKIMEGVSSHEYAH